MIGAAFVQYRMVLTQPLLPRVFTRNYYLPGLTGFVNEKFHAAELPDKESVDENLPLAADDQGDVRLDYCWQTQNGYR